MRSGDGKNRSFVGSPTYCRDNITRTLANIKEVTVQPMICLKNGALLPYATTRHIIGWAVTSLIFAVVACGNSTPFLRHIIGWAATSLMFARVQVTLSRQYTALVQWWLRDHAGGALIRSSLPPLEAKIISFSFSSKFCAPSTSTMIWADNNAGYLKN